MSRFVMPALVFSAVMLPASACYNYVPTEVGVVSRGEDVRLRVNREGGEELARTIESDEIQLEVSGQFEGLEQGSVLLRIPVVRDPTGQRPSIQQVVRLPEADVLTVDRRELSVGKTAALVGVGAGAVGFLLTQVFEVFDDTNSGGEDPQVSLIPLFNLLTGRR